MSSLYLISSAHVQTVPMPILYPINTVHIYTVLTMWRICPFSTPYLQYPNVFSQAMCNPYPSLQPMFRKYSVSTSESHLYINLYYPCLVRTPYPVSHITSMLMPSQITISPTPTHTFFQSECYMFYASPVSTPFVLPMSSQYTMSLIHVQSLHHLLPMYCKITTSPAYYYRPKLILPLMSMFRQYTIYPTHVQSVHHLCCPCTVSTLSHIPICS